MAPTFSFPIQDESGGSPRAVRGPAPGWRLLWWIGVLFFVVGMADVVLVFIPSNFGSPEWEFGSSVALLNGLTVPTMGLLLMTAAAVSLEWTGFRWPGRILLGLGTIGILLLGLLFITTVPIALRSTQEPMIALGLKKTVGKTLVQLIVYGATYLAALIYVVRWRIGPKPRRM